MRIWHKFILLCCCWWLSSALAWASPDYQQWVNDIQSRLDKTSQLYQQHNNDEARTTVQMAYFEVFENLEGPIRINISAQKSYQMEAAFGEIRRMIGEGKPQAEVDNKINWLKGELAAVLPVLTGGHKLTAEQQHAAYENSDIAVYWQQSFKIIDDLLAQAISEYQDGKFAAASQSVQQAHYQGFKNSEMEMSVRGNRSAQQAAAINQQFTALIDLTRKPDQITEVAYRVTGLLQTIEDTLPGLPTTREQQQVTADQSAAVATTAPDGPANADWAAVSSKINQAITTAISQYQKGQTTPAMMSVQDTYFDLFEASGMENKVGSRDAAFKSTLEGHFTRLVSLMKAGQPLEQLQTEAAALQKDLSSAVEMLGGGDETDWSLFIYSLLIIVREGLEALLIVAAIVAYLVKNNHHDKLPLIRQSVVVALIASVLTAFVFQWLFANSGQSRELLEGFTMMIAVVMLFSMSYWLLSKTEARQWKTYLEGKFSKSLSSGSMIGLWLTSFLAVYREGAETVLFYLALMGDASTTSGHLSILAGFGVGCVILLVAYLVMRFTVVKLPLKPFFMFTGGFMYLMAFVFAGKSVLELIEGKLFEPTLLPGVPEISWLGVYPYLETLIPQGILLVAALVALWVMQRRGRKLQSRGVSAS
ncbi:FTR1 family protein [Yersinia hibernica]|uniref:FTR1 family iron permease n=1 Tax=Yersinia hibernica TaxID=2339259 RepID=A0ABX5R722_9GAMM|nr:FTR1 family protein [Yersinia hibernica]QAX81149.1 FTR1 family iron permease [Yersinia hibernica]